MTRFGSHRTAPAPGPDSRGRRLVFYWLPVLVLCALIFWQSAFPSIPALPVFAHQDKLLHLGAYGVLSFFTARALAVEQLKVSPGALRLLAIVLTALYGLSDEVHQAFVPARDASFADLCADTLGSVLGACFYLDFLAARK